MIHEDTPIGTVLSLPWGQAITIGLPYRPLGSGEWLVKVRKHGEPGSRAFSVPCFMARVALRSGQQDLF